MKVHLHPIQIFTWLKARLELICWSAALLVLFLMPVHNSDQSLCIFRFIGFQSCPGCGLGHSIHYALHFQLSQSFHAHIFGLPAVLIILHRIKQLLFSKKPIAYEIQVNHANNSRRGR